MERINKATLFGNLLFEERKRKKFSKTACGSVLPFYSWNIPLCSEKKGFCNCSHLIIIIFVQ